MRLASILPVVVAAVLACAPAACAGAAPAPVAPPPAATWQTLEEGGVVLRYQAVDATLAPQLLAMVVDGRQAVERFFAAPFAAPFVVTVFPDRAQLTADWRQLTGDPTLETACWMVASGAKASLTILSPRVWAREACEHDAADEAQTRALVVHELTHVFHEQRLPAPGFDGMDDVAWFAEGLAVHVSGQLALGHLASAADAIAAGQAPTALEQAWTGKYRYGVSGSLVAYVDRRVGRARLLDLLALRTEAALLAAIGTSEAELLAAWRAEVEAAR